MHYAGRRDRFEAYLIPIYYIYIIYVTNNFVMTAEWLSNSITYNKN